MRERDARVILPVTQEMRLMKQSREHFKSHGFKIYVLQLTKHISSNPSRVHLTILSGGVFLLFANLWQALFQSTQVYGVGSPTCIYGGFKFNSCMAIVIVAELNLEKTEGMMCGKVLQDVRESEEESEEE
jgi:hypothetical protein